MYNTDIELPKGWEYKKLGDVCEININNISNKYPFDEINYFDISLVGNGYLKGKPKLIKLFDAPSRAKRIIKYNDIIISTVRPNLKSMLYINTHENNNIVSTGFTVLTPNIKICDSKYIYYVVNNDNFTKYLINNATGSSYPAITSKVIEIKRIPVPPLATQERISTILDKITVLVNQYEQQLKEYDNLIISQFNTLFGDPVINPKKYPVKTISEITSGKDKYRKPLNSFERLQIKGEYSYYGANGKVDCINDYLLEGQYLLIAEDGGHFLEPWRGVSYIVNEKFWANNHVHILECDNVNIRYLKQYLNSIQYYAYITGSTRLKLNQSALKNITVVFPPIEEQEIFSNFAEKIEILKEQTRNKLTQAQELFNSTSQQAFKGNI